MVCRSVSASTHDAVSVALSMPKPGSTSTSRSASSLARCTGSRCGRDKPMRTACDEIVDAHEHEIEAPCADTAPLQFGTKRFAQLVDDALEILRIADRLGEAQLGARHFGRNQRGQRFLHAAERLIEAQQHVGAEAQVEARARLARELRHALDPDIMQAMRRLLGERRSAATGRLAIASEARPGETIACLAITRDRPGAARRVGDRRLGGDACCCQAACSRSSSSAASP